MSKLYRISVRCTAGFDTPQQYLDSMLSSLTADPYQAYMTPELCVVTALTTSQGSDNFIYMLIHYGHYIVSLEENAGDSHWVGLGMVDQIKTMSSTVL